MAAKKTAPAATKYRDRKDLWTYWLTRDSDPDTGVADDVVRVWLSQPTRYSVGDHGCFWLAPMPDHFADWSFEECLAGPRVYPDDSRQCIRCGPLEDVRPDSTKESIKS